MSSRRLERRSGSAPSRNAETDESPLERLEAELEMVASDEANRATVADIDLLESTREYLLEVEMMELQWPGTQAEYEAWLDSLAPCEGELEHRDLTDCGLGHSAGEEWF